jgi:cell division protein FtsI/penicillin-binding protein 2
MRDVKNLTKKRSGLFGRLVPRPRTPTTNRFKRLVESRPASSRLRIILPLLVVLLALFPIVSLLISTKTASSSVQKTPAIKPASMKPLKELDTWQSFQLCVDSLGSRRPAGDHLQALLADGSTVRYALNEELQERVHQFMAANRVPYGAFVAIEPKTGRVLALTGFSAVDQGWEPRAAFQLYPMASLFKIITAAAALEQKKVSPDSTVAFNGKLTSVNPKYWYVRPRRNQEMSLTDAMGKSVNPVFGLLASQLVGRDLLVSYAERFGFNQPLFPGTAVRPSTADAPSTEAELKLMGAGLGREVKISPLHAAAMMGAVANRGVMMAPIMADSITNSLGEAVFVARPQQLRRVVSEETADQLARLLSSTVRTGTSRRAFHDRRGRPMLREVTVAAKTGSIDGKDPAGQYSWFAAYAPMDDPKIALVALVVNQGKWKVKASQVGEKALEAFFR